MKIGNLVFVSPFVLNAITELTGVKDYPVLKGSIHYTAHWATKWTGLCFSGFILVKDKPAYRDGTFPYYFVHYNRYLVVWKQFSVEWGVENC
jgi:hypothetical protein